MSSPIAAADVRTEPPGILTSGFFSYTSGAGYVTADTLRPGLGYWVKSSGAGALIVADTNVSMIVEDFETGSKGAYPAANVTLNTGIWNLTDALIGSTSADVRNGNAAVRIRNSGKVSMQFDLTTGARFVTIQHAKYGTDGATTWQTFWKLIFPLLAPMSATVGIFAFLYAWNDFMMPSLIISDPALQTLPVRQNLFQTQFSNNYNVAFASYLMAMAPAIVAYLFTQRWVMAGVTQGAVKG